MVLYTYKIIENVCKNTFKGNKYILIYETNGKTLKTFTRFTVGYIIAEKNSNYYYGIFERV